MPSLKQSERLLERLFTACACVRVCVCGWWSPWPSGARLSAVAAARLRLGHQKDERCWAVAASADGTAGAERDAVLNTHQAALALAGSVWIHCQSTSSWGWTTSVTDGWWEGDISLLHSTKRLLSPSFWTAAVSLILSDLKMSKDFHSSLLLRLIRGETLVTNSITGGEGDSYSHVVPQSESPMHRVEKCVKVYLLKLPM